MRNMRLALLALLTTSCRLSLVGFCDAASTAETSDDSEAFVRVSPRDCRYLELSNGRPFIPIGLNLVGPSGSARGSLDHGLAKVEIWMKSLARYRGNYIRIWLGHSFWDVEHQKSGEYDPMVAQRIDALLSLAKRYGIRVKLCLEYFRTIDPKWMGKKGAFPKTIHHVSQGGPFADMTDFLSSEKGEAQFKRKLDWYRDRYGDDPIILGWELWNEMDCVRGRGWEDWTRRMLDELHHRFPRNLAMQSLGSYDNESKRDRYRAICRFSGNDVAQVHRYLDLGARWPICHGPMDLLAANAVEELRRFDVRKPILLAETGGVEPSHSGPIRYYAQDKAGILLHDVLFAPFFSGAAGPGQIWHWGQYVHKNDLWFHFARFAEAVKGIDPPAEQFEPVRIEHSRLRVFALRGKQTTLAWCRDSRNNWQMELRDGVAPETIEKAVVDLSACLPAMGSRRVQVYDPWEDRWSQAFGKAGRIELPPFSRSIVIRIGQQFVPFFDRHGNAHAASRHPHVGARDLKTHSVAWAVSW